MNKKLLIQIIILTLAALAVIFFLSVSDVQMNEEKEPDSSESTSESIVVFNQGGSMEGHTPRGFQGMGTGLFIGDDLNPNFPENETVQVFLTFDISEFNEQGNIDSVILSSNDVHISGTPFADIGNLIVESISYDRFSSALWNLPSLGEVCVLTSLPNDSFECDVSEVVKSSLEDDLSKVQFRLRLEGEGDGDGRSDMVLFYKTNSNTNEPGIFRLEGD